MNPTITKIAIASIGVVAIGISAAVFAFRAPAGEPGQALGAMVSAPGATVAVSDGGCSACPSACSTRKK